VLVVLTGAAMSPWPLDHSRMGRRMGGGNRTDLHFIVPGCWSRSCSSTFSEVIVSGFWNHMRSMITGRYRTKLEVANEKR
jgi:hypothetical protein